ncbi:hypothetical protein A3A14_00175 [Candidatus Daviesbacteria bacterium RIFCSPLOWO2_01_FULL_43_38]|uniref:Glycosyltransferase RgtA/B/C/D-like domain-containing protein n=3 Tax=Candidatus Daviesiibacteriota TaxID=1752718 RepID=A0A1F5K461_9BACT|nr:MAG: hypothetical protein A2874_00815 [Candidatus Daviesbacteria bacterium RIFCSPHIGHO2_01_FULL_43_17]OGE35762.1 MAG: hypothetical protein A3E45_00500 [Candidatus Daviesbacteria bacterium RIFCSPHIGHO2_12_FULL_43_11]OGE63447.1 MAG: hypothetical protein A3A14_00175 [Candidatus Daviesbacteria bacterium RIFCSPLOWO2_01_FULL_43_38]OGE69674.1 MAG: hypothetical protein A3J21_03205 [Candidatus Daviesbacteria bacterium RIFCSPLOWO2_02_FULL_43_11]
MKLIPPFKLATLLLLLFFVASFLVRTDTSFDQDLGRHIKLGEVILNSREVPKVNLFSYTNPEFPVVNHHYLFEIFVYLGQQFIVVQALLWLKILIILSALGVTLSIVRKSAVFLTLPLSYIFLHVLRERTELRPEIFSFLFTALTLLAMEKLESGKRALVFSLPLIQLLWVSTHIYFPVGFSIQAVYLISFYVKKEFKLFKLLAGVFTVSVIVSLLNPNGLQGFLYPLTVFGNYGYNIAENQNLFLLESLNFRDPNFLFVKLSWALIIISIFTGAFRHTLSVKNLFLCLLGLMLSVIHIRSFPYLVFISLPGVIQNFGSFKAPKWLYIPIGIVSLLIIGESIFYLSGEYYKYSDRDYKVEVNSIEHIKKATDFMLANDLPQPIFNNFDIGSYIIYRGFPGYKVFVDGRPEAYPKEFFKEVYIPIQEDPKAFQSINEKIKFQTIIFSYTDQTPWAGSFLKTITQNPDWSIVFIDDFMIILVKNDIVTQKNLVKITLENLTPESFRFSDHVPYLKLSIFLLNTGYVKPAEAFAKKSLEIFPDSPIGNLILANIYGRSTDFLQISAAQDHYQKSQGNVWW